MNRHAIHHLRDRIGEFYRLENAERHLTALSDSQRKSIRAYYDAAERRLSVARDLRGPNETPAAVTLYRQGGLLLALAFLASKEPKDDLDELAPEFVFQKLDSALSEGGLRDAAELDRIKRTLLPSDPLDADRLSADEAASRAEELELATTWMKSLVDPRSPRELKTSRILRLATTVGVALAAIAMLLAWALAPSNIAKGKPATSSSVMFSTNPSGVVDGSKSGSYGFHSGDEDAAWVAIDLGKAYALNKVVIFGRGDGHTELSVPAALEVSDDGANYRQIATRSEAFSESDPWVVKPSSLVARFVRVRKLAHGYLVLSEVEAYGKPSSR